MPAPWWSAIDSEITSLAPTEKETEFRQFMTRANGTEEEPYLDPRTEFLQKVLFDRESQTKTNSRLEELAQKAGDEEEKILRLLLPQE